VNTIYTVPESSEMVSYLLAKQSGLDLHDSRVHDTMLLAIPVAH
jgi:hypothetical protein